MVETDEHADDGGQHPEGTRALRGVRVTDEEPGRITVRRETRESIAEVSLDDGPRHETTVHTGLNFFDHMLETIAWNACINLDVQFSHKRYRLMHVITEDVGLTFGQALRRLVGERTVTGINGAGSGVMGIDEAIALALISFEGRANAYHELRVPGGQREHVEDMLATDLVAFFDGVAQGAGATVHLRTLEGNDPHHVWEAVFRAFGVALRTALAPNPWRAGLTAGIKGTLD
jgi:imidazoleglycerol-phosphate dehydratase